VPNLIGPVIVVWTFTVAHTIIAESGLSFLGLGIRPPTATWGGMVSDGRRYLATASGVTSIPCIAITLVVLLINIAGQWLSERFDSGQDLA
jgi:ABC-type dipeptide/oligopeptide/nickel transport system permease subunit